MNCPVCDRSLASTLSICPACGTMMNDSVREELQTKITSGPLAKATSTPPMQVEDRPQMPVPNRPLPQRPPMIAQPQMQKRQETAGLNSSKTSPTLVEFQNKNSSLPDWRLQLQNAVQQRKGGQTAVGTTDDRSFPTNGGAALKAEIIPPVEAEIRAGIADPRVANAMKRIDQSRQTFLDPPAKTAKVPVAKPAPNRSFPFDVVQSNGRTAAAPAPIRTAPPVVKPKLVVPTPSAEKRDTNKLPPLPLQPERIERVIPIEETAVAKVTHSGGLPPEFAEIKRIRIKAENAEAIDQENIDIYDDEIEDLAPISMRFGAGLFDLIIAAFASMLLLSPFAFGGAEWSTLSGGLVFAATLAIVSFLYMTACVGFVGKTLGMRLFSLELVDAVENEYPTLHQAAINTSVFLVLLPFLGAGFATTFFNEENRALHDLLSGTILVREF
ncbi:MAG: RDD family protein [Pyrinomonadaceae bacterium]